MQDKTTIELTIDEDLEDYLKDTRKYFNLVAKARCKNPCDHHSIDDEEKAEALVLATIELAAKFSRLALQEGADIEDAYHNLAFHLHGYDPEDPDQQAHDIRAADMRIFRPKRAAS